MQMTETIQFLKETTQLLVAININEPFRRRASGSETFFHIICFPIKASHVYCAAARLLAHFARNMTRNILTATWRQFKRFFPPFPSS